jgi:hypothetical protein
MREEASEKPTTTDNRASPPAEEERTQSHGAAPTKGKKKGKGKKPRGENGTTAQPERKEISSQKEEGHVGGQSGRQARAAPPDPLVSLEIKGRGLRASDQPGVGPEAESPTTSRVECSGQKKPGS